MEFSLFLKGFALGFSIAAPVGPIGVLCIRRTLNDGRLTGFVSGLGAASADAIYGSLAAFGLTLVSSILLNQQVWMRLVGGAFLCYLGIKTLFTKVTTQQPAASEIGLPGAYFSTLLLTLANPVSIFSFAAVFAGLGLGQAQVDAAAAGTLVLGVFSGSAAWWLLLSSLAGFFRGMISPRGLGWVNRVSGVIILVFAAAILFGALS